MEMELHRLMASAEDEVSIKDGPGEGTWSVFAEKVVEQRDELQREVARQAKEIEKLARLTGSERLRCARAVKAVGERFGGLKATPTLRAIFSALDDALRSIESGDRGSEVMGDEDASCLGDGTVTNLDAPDGSDRPGYDEARRRVRRYISRLGVADCDDVFDALDGAVERIERDASEAEAEAEELRELVARQADILTGVANALRGDPGPLASHGHADLAERAAAVVAERDAAVGLLAEVWHEIATGRPPPVSDRTAWLAQVGDVVGAASYCAALDAARDALTREMDELRDAARAYLAALRHLDDVQAKVRRERDALRDAVRAYLAARDGWELSRVLGSTAARVTLDALDAARARLAALVGDAP